MPQAKLNMQDLVHGAVGAVDKVVTPFVREMRGMRGESKTVQYNMAERYAKVHRGNDLATREFVAKHMPVGANPIMEQHRYEQAMESLIRENGWKF